MPQFNSIDGVWHPVSKFTKRELEAQGKETLGRKQLPADKETVVNTEVDETGLDTNDETTKETLKNIRSKKGSKGSKKIKRKVI